MKTPTKYVTVVAAALSAAVVFFSFANSSLSARFPFGLVFAILSSAAIIGLAVYDYSRRAKSLHSAAKVLRPSLPVAKSRLNRSAAPDQTVRSQRIAA